MTTRTIQRIAVVGAGNMGSGIAQKAATEGFEVVLLDLNEQALSRGMARIQETLAEGVARKLFTPEAAAAIQARIHPAADLSAAGDTQLVIEAVFEDLSVKRDVFRKLDAGCGPEIILATNTSSFRVEEVAAGLKHPERVLGLHYFYHPAKNRLVEVVPHSGDEGRPNSGNAGHPHPGGTTPAVRDAAWAFAERMGKTPIASKDAPGFVVNRYFVPWLNEAVRLLAEGKANPATIDAAAKAAFHIGMGPFELMNVTGVPIAFHAATTLGQSLGEFYAPAPLLAEQAKSGKPWDLSGEPAAEIPDVVVSRLSGAALLAAGQLVDQGVSTIEDVDLGARVGLRWAKGPFEMANEWGVSESIGRILAVATPYGLTTPRVFAGRKGKPFRFARVKTEIADNIATITFNRPDAMNALNEEVVDQFEDAWTKVERDPSVRAVVLAGSGKAFVAGADIRFFVDCIDRKNLGRIRRFTEQGQALLRRIDESPKPVTVRLDGLSLGGGSEIALCADRILATSKGSLGFPETGIGIYPGLGGTQRLSRRVGPALAKFFILTGETIDAKAAAELGLAQLVSAEDLPAALRKAPAVYRYPTLSGAGRPAGPGTDNPYANPGAALIPPARFAKAAEFFGQWSVDDILTGNAQTSGDADAERWVRRVKKRAVPALKLAEKLIDQGYPLPLADGLALELDHLEEIFSTPEARAGLASVL